MDSKPTIVFGQHRAGKSVFEGMNFARLEKRAYALMAKESNNLPRMSRLEDLVLHWQNELDRQLNSIACNNKRIGTLSSSINCLTGCTGNDSYTTGRYCDIAIAITKKILPRGKAWRKLYDLDRGNGYGF